MARGRQNDGRARRRWALGTALAVALSCVLGAAPALAASGADAGADASGAAEGAVSETQSYVEDELIIVYEGDAVGLDSEAIVAEEELVAASDASGAVTVATIDADASVEELCEELAQEDGVASVQPNYEYELLDTAVDDPYAVADTSAEYHQYYLYESGFTSAWDLSQAAGTVTVAVLDTGCNLEHEDLAATVDAEHAYDAVTEMALAAAGLDNNGDEDGHGTMVCGIVSAVANNALGIAGASYNATVLPVRIYSGSSAKTSDVVAAYAYLDELIESGAVADLRVINISLGTYSASASGDTALHQAIASMLAEHDVLTVCAGGNGSTSAYIYPADFAECVSVTAVAADDTPAAYADHNDAKDLSAYGDDILSTSAEGGYAYGSGTSYAAPQVAAAAALIWATDWSLTSSEVVALLQASADEVVDEDADNGSAGILDAAEAVAAALDEDAVAEAVGLAEAAESTSATSTAAEAEAEADVDGGDAAASDEDDGDGTGDGDAEDTTDADDVTESADAEGASGAGPSGTDASGSSAGSSAAADATGSSSASENETDAAASDTGTASGAALDESDSAASDDLILLDGDAGALPDSGDPAGIAAPVALLGALLLALAWPRNIWRLRGQVKNTPFGRFFT